MTDREFLERYAGESVDGLLAYEGRYRTDSIVGAFEQAIQAKLDRGEPLDTEEMMVLAIEALEREVNNGGYDQFFLNSSKAHASVVVSALTRIGCPTCARITEDAIAALGVSRPLTRETIDAALDADSDERTRRLGACDEAYYANEEDIAGCLFEFLKANRDKIRLG